MSVAFRVALCASLSIACRRSAGDPPAGAGAGSSRNTSSSPSTARTTSRNGSAAARWRRGPARASPISCPASSCCRRETRARIPGAGQAAGQVQCRLRAVQAGSRGAARQRSGWRASEGHEIASHGCGHFDGKDWSKADWLEEFASFRHILRDAYTINGIAGEPAGWRDFADKAVTGSARPISRPARRSTRRCRHAGFAYDASGVSQRPGQAGRAATASRASRCRRSRKDRRRGASSPWTTICSCAIPAAFERRRRRRRLRRTAPMRLQGRLRRAVWRRAHSAAARLPLHADERRRLLEGAGALRRRGLRASPTSSASATPIISRGTGARDTPAQRRAAEPPAADRPAGHRLDLGTARSR